MSTTWFRYTPSGLGQWRRKNGRTQESPDSIPHRPPLTQQERTEARERFGKRGTLSWTGHRSIAELEKDVLALETEDGVLTPAGRAIDESFTLMLGWADRMVHTTGISTSSAVSVAPLSSVADLIMRPSHDHVPQAVMLTSTSYLLLLRLLMPHLDPSRRSDLDAIAARMWRSSHDVEQLLSIDDGDLCPCDHPGDSWLNATREPTSPPITRSSARLRTRIGPRRRNRT